MLEVLTMRQVRTLAAVVVFSVTGLAHAQAPNPWITVNESLKAVAIHAIMLPPMENLPSGAVLYFERTKGNDDLSKAHLWDPVTQSHYASTPSPGVELFCPGHAFDAIGRVVFAGGTRIINNNLTTCGIRNVTIYDPVENEFTDAGDMQDGRYYPTVVADEWGGFYIFSGNDYSTPCDGSSVNTSVEYFLPGTSITPAVVLGNVGYTPSLYPRSFMLSSGIIALTGPQALTKYFDTIDATIEDGPETILGQRRASCAAVLLPIDLSLSTPIERVLLIGGYVQATGATATCESLDANDLESDWESQDSLKLARAHADAVLLADGNVFLIGGGVGGTTNPRYQCPVLKPEVYEVGVDPRWSELTDDSHYYARMYHSTAVLLMDGSVWTAGQDVNSDCETGGPYFTNGKKVEIYRPDYWFDSSRPTITDSPTTVTRGNSFVMEFTVGNGRAFLHAVLIRFSSVTHSVNFSQRYLKLNNPDPPSGGVVTVEAPANEYAPPGPYMLVVVDDAGIPSVAQVLYLE